MGAFVVTVIKVVVQAAILFFLGEIVILAFLKHTMAGRLLLVSLKNGLKLVKVSLKSSKRLSKVLFKEAKVLGKYTATKYGEVMETRKQIMAQGLADALGEEVDEVVNDTNIIQLADYQELQKLNTLLEQQKQQRQQSQTN